MKKFKIGKINFDDFVIEEESTWSQVCDDCAVKLFKYKKVTFDDYPMEGAICGVKGCKHEAQYYVTVYTSTHNGYCA